MNKKLNTPVTFHKITETTDEYGQPIETKDTGTVRLVGLSSVTLNSTYGGIGSSEQATATQGTELTMRGPWPYGPNQRIIVSINGVDYKPRTLEQTNRRVPWVLLTLERVGGSLW